MGKFVAKYLANFRSKNLNVLDVGSQDINGSYKPLFNDKKWTYIGADIIEGKNVNIVLRNIYNWREIKSNSFDVIISGQTLEHVKYFWITMYEISRVLREDGFCCIIVPSSGYEHKYPLDCWRFFPDGLIALAKYVDLEIIDAYNCWATPPINNEENIWKDSILVCKKSKKTFIKKIKFNLLNILSKLILEMQLNDDKRTV